MKTTTSPRSGLIILMLLLASFMLLTMTGCDYETIKYDKTDTTDTTDTTRAGFTGIQLTAEDGRLLGTIGDASDDWRSLPQVGLTLSPAIPNPVQERVSIRLALVQDDSVRIWLDSAPGKLQKVLLEEFMPEGTNVREFNLADLTPGIYRAFIAVVRGTEEYTTYGDIKVE